MTKYRNCPNCAAPYDVNKSRCPYCGTAYFDMSIIDFDSHEAFYLKIKVNGMTITQLVVPEACGITTSSDTNYSVDCDGRKRVAKTSVNVFTNVEFHAVQDINGVLATIE